MKQLLFLLVIFSIPFNIFAQDLSGSWEGIIEDKGGNYDIAIYLSKVGSNSYSGIEVVKMKKSPMSSVTTRVSVKSTNNTVELTETEILETSDSRTKWELAARPIIFTYQNNGGEKLVCSKDYNIDLTKKNNEFPSVYSRFSLKSNNGKKDGNDNLTTNVKKDPLPKPQIRLGCISGNCENGIGTFIYRDEVYEGTYAYIGQFKNSKGNGQGKIVYKDSTVVEGYFVNNLIAEGTLKNSKTGEYFTGTFIKPYTGAFFNGYGLKKKWNETQEGYWEEGEFIGKVSTKTEPEKFNKKNLLSKTLLKKFLLKLINQKFSEGPQNFNLHDETTYIDGSFKDDVSVVSSQDGLPAKIKGKFLYKDKDDEQFNGVIEILFYEGLPYCIYIDPFPKMCYRITDFDRSNAEMFTMEENKKMAFAYRKLLIKNQIESSSYQEVIRKQKGIVYYTAPNILTNAIGNGSMSYSGTSTSRELEFVEDSKGNVIGSRSIDVAKPYSYSKPYQYDGYQNISKRTIYIRGIKKSIDTDGSFYYEDAPLEIKPGQIVGKVKLQDEYEVESGEGNQYFGPEVEGG